MIRHTLQILAAVVLLTACAKEESPGYTPPKVAEQTVLLYMPGRGLLPFYDNNINDLQKGIKQGVLGKGRMLVCWQPIKITSAQLLEVYYDANQQKTAIKALETYDSFDAGNPADVQRLFADAAAMAPAKSYGLIIGSHGKAWLPASSGYLPSARTLGPQDDLWTPSEGAYVTRSFGDPGHELDVTELAQVISSQAFKPEYLILDNCFMASIEVLYDLRHVVKQIVASPCEIMGAGFPYDRILPQLFTNNGAGYNLEKVCYEYWDSYMTGYQQLGFLQSGCISRAVTSELDALADVVKRIYAAKKRSYDSGALQSYENFVTHAFYDLGHYIESSCDDPALLAEFEAVMDRAFPRDSRLYTPSFYSAYNNRNGHLFPVNNYWGVSTSEPTTNSTILTHLPHTAWYRATRK